MKFNKPLKIEIMAIGSEMLSPYFQDSNSLYITKRLNELGLDVSFKTIVGDNWEDLLTSIRQSLSKADILFAIGGLGPTQDDITREAFASVLKKKLLYHDEILEKIQERFKQRAMTMPVVNKKQAYIIEGSTVLDNACGTAPGLWLEHNKKTIVLLPGPPHELMPMFESYVWPRLQDFHRRYSEKKIIKITGLTESKIESILSDIYPNDSSIRLTTLARPGQIEIHILCYSDSSQAHAHKKVIFIEKRILDRLKDNVFSISNEELEHVVGKLLTMNKETLAVAESCTGGYLGHRLTNVPGSSNYFIQGVIAYSNDTKIKLLGVSHQIIDKYGAVSAQVAEAMAEGIRRTANTNYGLSITGIAGPTGETPKKPVGLVYTALSWANGSTVKENRFLGDRKSIKFQSSQEALDMLRRFLLREKENTSNIRNE